MKSQPSQLEDEPDTTAMIKSYSTTESIASVRMPMAAAPASYKSERLLVPQKSVAVRGCFVHDQADLQLWLKTWAGGRSGYIGTAWTLQPAA
ncbi:hypothetical protein MRX96_033465 [Rhipicephalus microplus]